MITDFKLFEKEGDKFRIGTWVLLDSEEKWNVYPYVKIIDNNSAKKHYNPYNEDDYEQPLNDYYVETFSLITNEIEQFWVDDYEIDRELTPEEIEETKARIEAINYNL